jgi:hypothetical protein
LPVVQSRVRQAVLAVAGIALIVLARPSVLPVPGALPPTASPTLATAAAPAAALVTAVVPAVVSEPATSGPRPSGLASISLDGTPVSVRTSGPGQHTRLVFDGQRDQAVSILIQDPATRPSGDPSPGCAGLHLQLFAAGDQPLAAVRGCRPILAAALAADGSYTVDVSTDHFLPADFVVRLYDASPQVGEIPPGGSPVPIRTISPGQHVHLRFGGRANQIVTVMVRDPSQQNPQDISLGCDGARLDLLAPGGQALGGVARCSPLSSQRLPVDGTYIVDFSTSQELPSDFIIQLFAA